MAELRKAHAGLLFCSGKRPVQSDRVLQNAIVNANLFGRMKEARLSLAYIYSNEEMRLFKGIDIVFKHPAVVEKLSEDAASIPRSIECLCNLTESDASAPIFEHTATYFRLYTSAVLVLKQKKNAASLVGLSQQELHALLEATMGFKVLDMINTLLQHPSSMDRHILDGARLAETILQELKLTPGMKLSAPVRERANRIYGGRKFTFINESLYDAGNRVQLWDKKNASRDAFGVDGAESAWKGILSSGMKASRAGVLRSLTDSIRAEALAKLRVIFGKLLGGRVGTDRTLPLFEIVIQELRRQLALLDFKEIVKDSIKDAVDPLETSVVKVVTSCIKELLLPPMPDPPVAAAHDTATESADHTNLSKNLAEFLTRYNFCADFSSDG